MRRSVFFSKWSKYVINLRLSDVHQHVCIREAFHGTNLIALSECRYSVKGFTAVVLLQNFTVGYWCDSIVIVFEPACFAVWFDKSKVVATMEVA